ncbi:MAG: 50S ribosomal protein L24 [Candidatus Pacebacteria bacterium]|nr:50S ribosomal protein L24 [Candidatus Paceibacterota bacterium]
MVKLKIKKGDKVIVITGKDSGKTGEVFEVQPTEMRLKVRGVNMVKRHTKQTQTTVGGIIEKEATIHVSNVALIDPKDGKATRVGYKKLEDGRKVRFAKRSGETIDA